MRNFDDELDLDLPSLSDLVAMAGSVLSGGGGALDRVARWLVRDLVERKGERSATELTDAAFAVLHPELGGRRLEQHETKLIADYNRIKRDIVQPILAAGTAAPAAYVGPPAEAAGTDTKVPAGYKPKWRTNASGVKVMVGLSRSNIHEGGPRLEVELRKLRDAGVLTVTDDHIDTFQRMANVETGGGVQSLNTWDAGVVSIGFFQLTLLHDKLQALVRRAPEAFERYGIALDAGRTYKIGGYKPTAIKGAATASELRWNGWADRFYRAGLDRDVIRAEVEDGADRLQTAIRTVKKSMPPEAYQRFWTAYQGSMPLRGLAQEAMNNLPGPARQGIRAAAMRADATDPARFYEIAKQTIPQAFAAYARKQNKSEKDIEKFRQKGQHIVDRTATLRLQR